VKCDARNGSSPVGNEPDAQYRFDRERCCYGIQKILKRDDENCDDPYHLLVATISSAQSDAEEVAIRKILDEEVAAWNKGDADAYSRHCAPDGTFTNLLRMFFQGREAFRERHEQIFSGAYRGSTKQLDVVSLKFVRPDVAIVETLQTVTDFQKLLPGNQRGCKRAVADAVVAGAGEGRRRVENCGVSQRRRERRRGGARTAMNSLGISC
jgi:uncharacterized protein (TIGR02246 family)